MITNWKAYHRNYWQKRRQQILDYLGGKCVVCGTTEELEVDHIDPTKKSFSINKRCSLEQVKDELEKCQLLCKSHHKEKTILQRQSFTHGTQYAWMKKKCRCEICLPAWREWHNDRNIKRRKKRNVAK